MILPGSAVQVKRLGCRIMIGEEAVDGRLQVDDRMKAASLEAPSVRFNPTTMDSDYCPKSSASRAIATRPISDCQMQYI
ncbi:hypothetical protein LCM4576_22370 [Mesorhizobium sp. LCM 4576]|nr:hypothetical protein LCM4576_22370 [Mesorhizobium sp. LCM 4576]